MKYRWHLRIGLSIALAGLAAAAAERAGADIRSFIASRQELRAELLACMSDGQLDVRERALLEEHASDKLPPAALAAFQETLDRMQQDELVPAVSPRRTPNDLAAQPVESTVVAASTHRAPVDPAVPVIWSDPEPEIPLLGSEVPAEDAPVLIDAALGDEFWEIDDATLREPPAEPTSGPLRYTSRIAHGLRKDTSFVSSSDAAACSAGCDTGCGEPVCYESACAPCGGPWPLDWIQVSAVAESFQGPMDLDGLNGNFGVRFAVNGALPLSRAMGIGVQAGTSGSVSDFHGTQYTGSRVRSQNFTTVGIFQRVCLGPAAIKYGFAFDWLFDDYYTSFTMSQWRVKLGWEVSPVAEIGLWSTIPNDGDDVELGASPDLLRGERFKPFAQGSLYWTRCWMNGTTTTAYVGIAEEPGEWVFGGDARIPVSGSLAFVGNLHYILPSADGLHGQDEETWNLGLGFQWTPGPTANHCRTGNFAPLFRLADNGTLAVRRY